MLQQRRRTKFTPAEYLNIEEAAEYKSEYYQGEVFAMVGGTADHSRVKVRLVSLLEGRLGDSTCGVYDSDLRLHIEASDLYTYPDAMVICDKIRFVKGRTDTVLNPTLIVEVLSKSTRDYDRGDKFDFYKQIPSLQEYLLIDSEQPQVERYHLREGEWVYTRVKGLEATMSLASVACDLPLAELYRGVSWL